MPTFGLNSSEQGRFSWKRLLCGYFLAASLCVAILLVRLGIGFTPGDAPMLVLYMIPVIASACVGGLWPGLFCSAFAAFIATYFLLEPIGSLTIGSQSDRLNWIAMLLTGTIISILVEYMHRLYRRSEENLERYRIVADNTYAWEFWIDPGGKSLYQSPSSLRITGYDASEFMADPNLLERIVHPDDLPLFKIHRHGIVSDKSPGEIKFRIIRPDGQIRWIEHFCHPVFGRDGEYLGARGSNSDITLRRRMEDTLVQTEKLMTVGTLAAGMAHEINNPLEGILLGIQNVKRRISLDLAANRRVAEEQGYSLEKIRNYLQARQIFDFLEAIEDSGQRATRIVRDMLTFSRKESSKTTLADVNDLVEKSISLCANGHVLENTCNFTGILVEVDLDPNRPKVPCVPSQIEQVLLNLLQNAVHAMEDRQGADPPPRIIVRTRGGVEKVRIEVQDNGPGMEPEVLKQAFDPFFTTKEPGKGTGLGLSVAYYIMTNHKGSLRVESLPGEGATFVLELPK